MLPCQGLLSGKKGVFDASKMASLCIHVGHQSCRNLENLAFDYCKGMNFPLIFEVRNIPTKDGYCKGMTFTL